MQFGRHDRYRASGLVRALVVASATLAILMVCFSIYQYSQLDPDAAARLRSSQLTPPSDEPGAIPNRSSPGDAPGFDIGPRGTIGPGRGIHISLYPSEGQEAQLDLAVADWTPIGGTSNQFLLTAPDVRYRTKNGHAIKVTADQGLLEGQRRGTGGLDPQRGKLTGRVVILYDRLSESDRSKLPPERRDRVDEADLVRLEMEELEFDREYSKLIVPGRLHLSARDVEWETGDLEIRFNDAENRVERMRVAQGGRLVLRDQGEGLGLTLPQADGSAGQRQSVVEWLRASIQSKLDRRSKPVSPSDSAESTMKFTEDGVPVFHPDAETEKETKPPMRYYARFEGSVDAAQLTGEVALVRLEADLLELVREFSVEDRSGGGSTAAPSTPGSDTPTTSDSGEASSSVRERLVLTWSDRLLVEVCGEEDDRCAGNVRSKLMATGASARITHPSGDAVFTRLVYNPDGSKLQLFGTASEPVEVRYADQGTLTGLTVHSERRHDDEMYVHVTGPGTLIRDEVGKTTLPDNLVAGRPVAVSTNKPAAVSPNEPGAVPADDSKIPPTIEFADHLEATGRFKTVTGLDITGHVFTRKERVLETASFVGTVRMTQDGMGLRADAVTLAFGKKPGLLVNDRAVERVSAQGHVVMTENTDRVTCREIDITFAVDPDGRSVPREAVALGDVLAEQQDRTIQARDKLIVAFETIERPPVPFDPARARAVAAQRGVDVATIDWEARRREHEAKLQREVVARRIQAFGEVSVHDSGQEVDVSADHLDCEITSGREIETALVEGRDDRPASVRLDTFTVTGQQIRLNVPDEWAEVPGPGRLAFRSYKDLDGRKLDTPNPIAITWADWMKYQGRENRSVFTGRVHATSQSTTTFDCRQLEIEFDDVVTLPKEDGASEDWWIFQDLIGQVAEDSRGDGAPIVGERFSKEPAYVLATGNAVALTSEFDEDTGKLRNRARISGPRLSVNLRSEVSKMMIEGAGNLLLEDNRPTAASGRTSKRLAGGLFGGDESGGPSTTLIEWDELMWYDFSIDQTRFEGGVSLKSFSGSELERIRQRPVEGSASTQSGRATFLNCDVLTLDFLDSRQRSREPDDRRMGRISADRLKQFQASGSVRLQDVAEGLSLTADRVVYWKDRSVLAVYGTPQRKAYIVTQKPGQLPSQVTVERLFYDLSTGKVELSGPTLRAR